MNTQENQSSQIVQEANEEAFSLQEEQLEEVTGGARFFKSLFGACFGCGRSSQPSEPVRQPKPITRFDSTSEQYQNLSDGAKQAAIGMMKPKGAAARI
jgi:hypothetical protein